MKGSIQNSYEAIRHVEDPKEATSPPSKPVEAKSSLSVAIHHLQKSKPSIPRLRIRPTFYALDGQGHRKSIVAGCCFIDDEVIGEWRRVVSSLVAWGLDILFFHFLFDLDYLLKFD